MNFSLSRELLRSASKLAIVAATAGLLAGCTSADTFSSSDDRSPTESSMNGTEPDGQDFVGGAAYWGAKYQANRDDLAAGMGFARNLRLMGGARQAVTVLKDLVMKAPDNAHVLSEYGKALTSAGRVREALPFLARSTQINGDDWTTFSAYGVALDQTGNHAAARANYQTALDISPDNPTVESNLAMSHVLEGEIGKAETILRRLVARPDATAQMRQNLAMVAAIQGNSIEAEQLAREDLTPPDAKNNLTLLQQFDARNVAINIQPLAPPEPAPIPAPTLDTSEILKPEPGAEAKSEEPKAAQLTPAALPQVSQAVPVPRPAPVMMAPIPDSEDAEPVKAPKPVTPKAPQKPAPASAALSAPDRTPAPQPIPAAAPQAPVPAPAKPTAILRKSLDTKSGAPASIEVANANR